MVTRELKKTFLTTFIVVDAPSSYNIILGRPAMNELKAVASTYHQKIKFPAGNQVGEVLGDQPSSRKCYMEAVRVDQNSARREGKRGYHQIPLAKSDQDKASFITSGGTFCYVVIPFGLKNVEATYQHLMKRVFEKQLGRNVEVYVDDILGKSRDIYCFISDLEETFATLMHYGKKLNPAKCIFGMKSGRFLGFLDTDRGIKRSEKADRENCFTFLVHIPICTSKLSILPGPSEGTTIWMDEKCEQAFKDLKSHLAELPVLVKPEPGEKLFVYLSTTKYDVSSVLAREEGSDQKLVYYVSHAFRGPELRYSEWRRYPGLGCDCQETAALFSVLSYHQSTALSDFLSEILQPDKEEVWRVFVDETSSLSGCGVGVVIIDPLGENIKLTLRIDSRETKNEAKCEAVMSVKGVYEAKDERMPKYLNLIKAQPESFVDWSIEQIPWEENGEADTSAKMAASLSEFNTREVFHVTRLFFFFMEEEMLPALVDSWMTPLVKFITHKELPEDRAQAQNFKRQAPRRLISDNGRQFYGKEITSWCQEMKAYRTTPRAPNQETLFNLVYDSEAVLPVEIGQSSATIESYPDDNDQSGQ
ncbi:uncharacterized protein [Primulina eburnea]|uniref:uncharacterized protein n=1 Tax=Primulina eburnea TaxID=1245227 RepID=UPI003C6BEA34